MAVPSPSEQDDALQRLLSLQSSTESDAAFAERLGLAPQVLSNYKNEHHGLSLRSALRVHETAGISLDWLLAGKGSPKTGDGAENGSRPFEAGGRYVYDRLLRSLMAMTEAAAKAGIIGRAEAREIREPVERYLGRGPASAASASESSVSGGG